MGNPFWHIELRTTDVTKTKKFLNSLFDWEFDDSHKDYTIFRTGEEVSGGIMENPPSSGTSSHWVPVIEVEDIRASTQKAVQLGGRVIEDVAEEGEWGWTSTVIDPTGAMIHLFQQRRK